MTRLASFLAAGLVLATAAIARGETYRPLIDLPTGYTSNQATGAISFTPDSITATAATLAPFIQAVRLVCTVGCFTMLSVTNGSAQAEATINAISGSYLPPNVPAEYGSTGGEYVIVIGRGSGGTLYVQALTK